MTGTASPAVATVMQPHQRHDHSCQIVQQAIRRYATWLLQPPLAGSEVALVNKIAESRGLADAPPSGGAASDSPSEKEEDDGGGSFEEDDLSRRGFVKKPKVKRAVFAGLVAAEGTHFEERWKWEKRYVAEMKKAKDVTDGSYIPSFINPDRDILTKGLEEKYIKYTRKQLFGYRWRQLNIATHKDIIEDDVDHRNVAEAPQHADTPNPSEGAGTDGAPQVIVESTRSAAADTSGFLTGISNEAQQVTHVFGETSASTEGLTVLDLLSSEVAAKQATSAAVGTDSTALRMRHEVAKPNSSIQKGDVLIQLYQPRKEARKDPHSKLIQNLTGVADLWERCYLETPDGTSVSKPKLNAKLDATGPNLKCTYRTPSYAPCIRLKAVFLGAQGKSEHEKLPPYREIVVDFHWAMEYFTRARCSNVFPVPGMPIIIAILPRESSSDLMAFNCIIFHCRNSDKAGWHFMACAHAALRSLSRKFSMNAV